MNSLIYNRKIDFNYHPTDELMHLCIIELVKPHNIILKIIDVIGVFVFEYQNLNSRLSPTK